MTKPQRTKFVLEHYGQARIVVPFADFKIYAESRRLGLNYRDQLIRYGRRFFKKLGGKK